MHNPDVVLIRKVREDRKYRQRWLLHTLSRKNLMALTGFFLCLFLFIHLFGNLQLLLPAEVARWQFNFYSKQLSENILIELVSYVLFASILAHAIYALLITIQNRRSSGKRYEYDRRGVSSKWYSRKMGLLGTIILLFLINGKRKSSGCDWNSDCVDKSSTASRSCSSASLRRAQTSTRVSVLETQIAP